MTLTFYPSTLVPVGTSLEQANHPMKYEVSKDFDLDLQPTGKKKTSGILLKLTIYPIKYEILNFCDGSSQYTKQNEVWWQTDGRTGQEKCLSQ